MPIDQNEYIIKEFTGFSGSKIYLMKNNKGFFVRKINNTQRNYLKLNEFSKDFNVPKILSYKNNVLDMEYIHGLDMKSYLYVRDPKRLTDFLINILTVLSQEIVVIDYTEIYKERLNDIKHF